MMEGFWLKFTDGSSGYCQGGSAYDAVQIAEKVSGKTVAIADEHKWQPERSPSVRTLPYPAKPIIWQFEHPVSGKCPPFCHSPSRCAGNSSCPQSYACSE